MHKRSAERIERILRDNPSPAVHTEEPENQTDDEDPTLDVTDGPA